MTRSKAQNKRYWLAFVLIYGLNLGLVAYALPASEVFGDQPWGSPDYQTHYQQSTVLTDVVDRYGKFWAYDPHMLAGQPVGLIFDVDNKLHFLWTYGLTKLGVPRPAAFNLFTVLACLLIPFSFWFAARLLGFKPKAQLWVMAMGIALWYFDSTARFCWTAGMISFAMTSQLCMVVIGLFYRFIETRSWKSWFGVLVMLPLALLTHVWAFAVLAVPMIGLYLRAWRSLGSRGHLQIWGLAVFAILVNSYWLVPALLHFDWIAPSGIVGQASPLYVLTDWLELLVSPINTGFVMPHTLFRFAAIVATVFWLVRLRRDRDQRFFLVCLGTCWLFGLAYFASLIPGLRETEPYRFVIPATFWVGVTAGPWLAETMRPRLWAGMSKYAKGLLLFVALLVLPRLIGQMVYFLPELSPETEIPKMAASQSRAAPTSPRPTARVDMTLLSTSWRMHGVDPISRALAAYMGEICKTAKGRVLVQHWAFGEFLRWATPCSVVGGFPDRRLIHEAAYLFRRPTDPRFYGSEFAEYIRRYNIEYLIMTDRIEVVEDRRDVFKPFKVIGHFPGGFHHRIYRANQLPGYVAHGTARVRADINRIEVADAQPSDGKSLVLRYHYMRGLRCSPNCTLEREAIPHDTVGMIRVRGNPELPRNFVIEFGY